MSKKVVILLIITLLIAVGIAIPLLKNKVAEELQTKLGSNFYYNYEDVSISLWDRKLELTNLSFAYPKDSSKFEYIGTAESFAVKDFDFFALLFSKSLEIGRISLTTPTLKTNILNKRNGQPTLDSLKVEDLNFYAFIDGALDELTLNQFITTNGKFDWFNSNTDSIWRSIDGINLSIDNFRLDSTVAANNNGWFTLEDVTLSVQKYTERLPDSIHSIFTDSIYLSYAERKLSIQNLQMKSRYSRAELRKLLKFQKDIITLNVGNIILDEIDIDYLIYQEELFVGKALIQDLELTIFKDKHLEFPHQLKRLPMQVLKEMSFNFTADEVKLNNAKVTYEQTNPKGEETGGVVFNEIDATIYNLTSSEDQIKKNAVTDFKAKALLQGTGKIDLAVAFDLTDTTGGHQVKGSISPFSLPSLNMLIVPLTPIKIQSGESKGIHFDFYANTYGTNGELRFLYEDLSVLLLKKFDLKSSEKESRWLGTLLLNQLVVRKHNPMGDLLRIGKIQSERNREKSIFNLWWEGIASGMSSTMLNFKKDSKEITISKK